MTASTSLLAIVALGTALGSLLLAGNALASYSSTLSSPVPAPLASAKFAWSVSGARSSVDQEISSVTITGCWTRRQVASVSTSAGSASVQTNGSLRVTGLQDGSLPLTVSATFNTVWTSANGGTVLAIGSRSGSSLGTMSAGGPTCRAPTTPGAPSTVTATQLNSAIGLSWTAPSNGGYPITSYTVSCSPACPAGTTGLTVSGNPPSAATTIAGPLLSGTSYSFTARAANQLGTGAASAPSNAVAFARTPDPPTAVTTSSGPGLGQVTVGWTRSTAYGAPVTGYAIACAGGCPATATGLTAGGTATSTVVDGLTPGSSYAFTVTAGSGVGSSASSTASPAAIAGTNGLVTGLAYHSCTSPFAAFNWPDACWRPYASASPFNVPIPPNPQIAANSRAIVQTVLGFGSIQNLTVGPGALADDWGHPTYYSQASDPLFTLHCTENWGTCPIEGMQIRVPDAAKPATAGDAHMTIVDQSSGIEYDLWGVQSKPAGGGALVFNWGGRTRIDGDGTGSGATASDFGNLAGIIRPPELIGGQINHALFMVVKCDDGAFVSPANKSGASCAGRGITAPAAPPMGARFQLAMSDAEIDALNVPGWKKTILRAMAHYGLYMGDTGGGSWGIELESPWTYSSFGVDSPLLAWAQQQALPTWNGDYVMSLKDGVDWAGRLRVIDPCVAQGTCPAP